MFLGCLIAYVCSNVIIAPFLKMLFVPICIVVGVVSSGIQLTDMFG